MPRSARRRALFAISTRRRRCRLVVTTYVRFPLSLRNVEDLLFERGIDLCHETVRHWGLLRCMLGPSTE